ncbi:peptidoglycan-binding protein LysM [Aquimarina sp. BL5]|uniref:peptidoglycan-binding protein LysM n=1 Tax=Aquimarina sp. BL5 TaxID=1714860 RepID=UPI000E48DFC7|nr:peptidoglycan-binding protein LysM [Aquimarina sp. BL5]AXT50138.1 peptidoglycan-binding protein LysM [Aquimarina sp. BL5]RKN03336.1 peptidoglycan-binding protein LysM [Aquimarina sp. BL5]
MIKRIIGLFVILTIGGIVLVSFTPKNRTDLSAYSTAGLDLYYIAPNFNEIEDDLLDNFIYPELGKSYVGFKEALAFKESRGDYGVVNQFGYMGKYQFGIGTLAMIGIKNKNTFLSSPELQERAFYANLSRNKWILRRDLKWFVGKRMNGIVVTESGVLAAAHLAGPGAVKKYLRSGGVDGFADAFGTTIRYYMKRFSGFDTSFVVPDRKAKA